MELQERLHRYGKLCIRPMMLQFSTFRRLGYGGYLRKWEGIFSFSFFYKRLWMCGRNIEYMEWLWERGPKVKLHWKTFCTRLWSFVLFCFFLEKAMATHYITLAWKIPWTEEPGGLQSMGSLRVGDTDFTFTFHFYAMEKEMATHSSVLAWRISGMGEPGGLPSMGSYRVRHDWSDLAAAAWSF